MAGYLASHGEATAVQAASFPFAATANSPNENKNNQSRRPSRPRPGQRQSTGLDNCSLMPPDGRSRCLGHLAGLFLELIELERVGIVEQVASGVAVPLTRVGRVRRYETRARIRPSRLPPSITWSARIAMPFQARSSYRAPLP
jgi:hypothetical protein